MQEQKLGRQKLEIEMLWLCVHVLYCPIVNWGCMHKVLRFVSAQQYLLGVRQAISGGPRVGGYCAVLLSLLAVNCQRPTAYCYGYVI